MTLTYPLNINQGETWAVTFPVVDSAGTAPPLAGWTGRAQIRRIPTEPILYEWIAAAGNITLTYTPDVGSTPAQALVTLSVTRATSLAWPWTKAVYDLVLTDTAGNVSRVAQGPVTVNPETTY